MDLEPHFVNPTLPVIIAILVINSLIVKLVNRKDFNLQQDKRGLVLMNKPITIIFVTLDILLFIKRVHSI